MRAYLALGSNLGDREEHLRRAVDAIPDRVDVSSVWETDPVGGPPGQGAYLNMVVALETDRSPRELLEVCRALEAAAARVRVERWGPRTLDVDVLLVGDLIVDEPDLTVPHPRMWERPFVLAPLAEIAPDVVGDRLATLDTSGLRRHRSLFGDSDPSIAPKDVSRLFGAFDGTWAIAGGWAIELFVCHAVRPHHDMDVAVARVDVDKLPEVLPGWELFFPAPGAFVRWAPGVAFPPDQNQLWCRPSAEADWTLEILVEEITDGVLRFRRDPLITLPVDDAVLRSSSGIPYIAPQVQLLYKQKASRPRDEVDFDAALPLMDDRSRSWLAAALLRRAPGHPWVARLGR